ncbi:hypothetical protein [Acidianus sulfidivorans]|nr:hypothetical protein [Acidianus sulfidivorans]
MRVNVIAPGWVDTPSQRIKSDQEWYNLRKDNT